jgi:VanZ family protein
MGMQTKPVNRIPQVVMKVILWVLVAFYTFMLPNAIIVYRAIVTDFGKVAAGEVPLVFVVIVGIAYAAAILISHRSWKNLLFLVPCGAIALAIMKLVDNPNKHIHIPEYVLMAWLLYAVLSRDHKGKGLLILIFIYGSMLGVVDELEQGINPARFYGLSDMMVNSASVLIGVFTIMGLKKIVATDWAWTRRLMEFKALAGLGLFGLTGAVIMCAHLFNVQAAGKFWGVYPNWLLVWNMFYLVLTPAVAFYRGALPKNDRIDEDGKDPVAQAEVLTARLWIVPLIVILLYMHALVVYVAGSGVKFD